MSNVSFKNTVMRLAVICFVIYSVYNHYQSDDRFLMSLWWGFSTLNAVLISVRLEKDKDV